MLDLGSDDESSSDSGGNLFKGQDSEKLFAGCDEEDDLSDDELFEKDFASHKRNYYISKMKYPELTE